MNRDEKNYKGTISIPVLLTIVFMVLKLCKVIDWSWFWVLFPIIFVVGLAIIAAVLLVILEKLEKDDDQ